MKSVDFDKKLPRDLSEGIGRTACILVAAVILTAALIGLVTMDYMRVKTGSEVAVDSSRPEEPFRLDFNLSLPAVSRKFAMADVRDALETKHSDSTTAEDWEEEVVYVGMQDPGATAEDQEQREPKHGESEGLSREDVDVILPIHKEDFEHIVSHYPIAFVNFYASWCPWSQKLAPSWDAATREIHEKYPESDGRIRMAKVDCTIDVALCRENHIMGFPTMRVFRNGHSDIYVDGRHTYESYIGDRTTTAIVAFAESLVPSAGNPHTYHQEM